MRPKQVPYFSQWESRELTTDVLERGAAVALMADPRWASSGARSASEYAQWANSLCGMACLKMILAARTGRSMPTLDLARKCTEYGGYTLAETGEIKGLATHPSSGSSKTNSALTGRSSRESTQSASKR